MTRVPMSMNAVTCMAGSRLMFKTSLLMMVTISLVDACVFDCHGALCGSSVKFVNHTFKVAHATEPSNTLDLSGRGITAIAQGGLDCFFFDEPVDIDDDDLDDSYYGILSKYTGTKTQAVLLDDNLLTEIPDMDLFHGTQAISLRNNHIIHVSNGSICDDFGGTRKRLMLNLQNNSITSLVEGQFSGCNGTVLIVVDLSNNLITSLAKKLFTGYNGQQLGVVFSNNVITSLAAGLFTGFNGHELGVFLSNNVITSLVEGWFTGFKGRYLNVDLSNNVITSLVEGLFTGTNGQQLIANLSHNVITSLMEGLMTGFNGQQLSIFLADNSITSLVEGVFSGFKGHHLSVFLPDNKIASVGGIFKGMTSAASCTVDLSNNLMTTESLQAVLNSFLYGTSLTLNVSRNSITEIPAELLAQVSLLFFEDDIRVATVTLDVSYNPITNMNESAFAGTTENTYESGFTSITIDLSNPTNGPMTFPKSLSFKYMDNNMYFKDVTFSINLTNTGAPLTIVNALSGLTQVHTFVIDLSYNDYTYVPPDTFNVSRATRLVLSHNSITTVSPKAFGYNLYLSTLDLSYNALPSIDIDVVSSLPVLTNLLVSNNKIWALPLVSNRIIDAVHVTGNTIVCDTYGPTLTSEICRCDVGKVYSEQCGYARCMDTTSGCTSPSFMNGNGTHCSVAPSSACVLACPVGQYHDTTAMICLPTLDCSTAFVNHPRANRGAPTATGHLPAYEVYPPTLTTNRECSICPTCEHGFNTIPCTATTNTQCERSGQLAPGDIASIILAALVLIISTAISFVYGKTQSKKRNMTQGELEMTELLLGDVTEKHGRVAEENERMQRAWAVDEADLRMGAIIGNGAFGTVFSAVWGHIPVAVKVLKMPLDDLDPLMSEDFNREVTFMQSIRHPNLLTFYGAGINAKSQAFLVTELMEKGSLRTLLLDQKRQLDWSERLSFAKDIARGMKYLHERDTIHRDLKSDNCFVDTNFRVKVADFGTGRIQSDFAQAMGGGDTVSVSSALSSELSTRTLTTGMGTLLWLAPEALRGDKISPEDSYALDAYSFAVVMWEIWARAWPWDEVEGDGFDFVSNLTELVNNGHRPQLPPNTCDAPGGYAVLMGQCWSTTPSDRPSFAITLDHLESIFG